MQPDSIVHGDRSFRHKLTEGTVFVCLFAQWMTSIISLVSTHTSGKNSDFGSLHYPEGTPDPPDLGLFHTVLSVTVIYVAMMLH